MLNQVILVGRLVEQPTTKKVNESEVANITLAVPRSYKNANGEYETDFIDCVLWNGVATNTAEYCKKGDLIGVRGRIQVSTYETEEGNKRKSVEVVAEKVTFLSTKKVSEENEEE